MGVRLIILVLIFSIQPIQAQLNRAWFTDSIQTFVLKLDQRKDFLDISVELDSIFLQQSLLEFYGARKPYLLKGGPENLPLIEAYLKKNFHLKRGNQELNVQWLGLELRKKQIKIIGEVHFPKKIPISIDFSGFQQKYKYIHWVIRHYEYKVLVTNSFPFLLEPEK
jgi:hypothetical protein